MICLRTVSVCVVLAFIGFAWGCDSGPELTPLQGQVSFRGMLLDHGMINFFPESGRPVSATIQLDGTYTVQLPLGSFGVAIIAPAQLPAGFKEGDPIPPPDPNALPSRYSQKETSGLTAIVEAGSDTQTVNFELK